MPDCIARFEDQLVGVGFRYTLQWGTSPGRVEMTVPVEFSRRKVPLVGTLNVSFRNRRFLRLTKCLVVDPTDNASSSSTPYVTFGLLDRRWRWQYGTALDGDYNVEQPDGTLLREKTPRELATLIFAALGEPRADVGALPAEPRPRKAWYGASPVDELDTLCREFGCAPTFDPFGNLPRIVKIGVGPGPPNLPTEQRVEGRIIAPPPDAIRVVGGSVLFQTAILLGDPQGKDVDGQYHPIDDLSYKPTMAAVGVDGWSGIEPHQFGGLNTTYTDKATGETLYHRDLAQNTVWRIYKMQRQAAGGFSPDVLKNTAYEPRSTADWGRFTGTVLEKDSVTGARLPAYVRGTFADERLALENSPPKTRFPGSVSINSDLKLVTFGQAVFKRDANGHPVAADLELISSYEVAKDGVPVRYEQFRNAQRANGAGDHREYHDEIIREIAEATASATGKKTDNLADVQAACDYYLNALETAFLEQDGATHTYSGLERFALTGALRSVSWTFSISATPQTQASWHTEHNRFITPYERRPAARVQRQIEAAARQAMAAARVDASRRGIAEAVT